MKLLILKVNLFYSLIINLSIDYLENYGVLMLHSLFEHWPVTKQALGIFLMIFI
jgi:hypothetical protein